MSWIVGIIIAIVCIAEALYTFGSKHGHAKALRELKDFRAMLLLRRDEIFKKHEAAIAYHDKIVAQSDKLLAEAESKASHAYADKEQSLRSIITIATSLHPDNHYLSSVLLDAEETILGRRLYDLSNTAPKTASAIKKKFNEKARQWRLESRFYKYQTLFYESLFPDLSEYAVGEVEAEEKREVHPSDWLPDDEYQKLSDIQKLERAQIALDRYVSGQKSKWEVGRDYELYVGYLFRKKGWSVIQNGVTEKLKDMGRDLICHKDGVTLIVQCKFWSQNKEIHEKHITQLLGTTLAYAVEHNLPRLELGSIGGEVTHVIPVFVTSTRLSETAQRFAEALHVQVRVVDFDPRTSVFPRIKCNIGKEGKIFHLPFDQMYDRAVISSNSERYAFTVEEAMSFGFRRAHRWMGDS